MPGAGTTERRGIFLLSSLIEAAAEDHKLFVTMEENVASGGYGERVREFLENRGKALLSIAIPDEYVEHGNVDILRQELGIDADSIKKKILAAAAAWRLG